MRKKKIKKPYKSLDEIYLNNTPKISVGTKIIFLKERADVVIQRDAPHGDVREFEVSDDTANKLIKSLDIEEPNKQKINNFLASKGFKPESYKDNGYVLILDALFNLAEEDIKRFSAFIDSPEKPQLKNNLSGNLFDIGSKAGLTQSFIKRLSTVEPKDINDNSVGPGEILLGILFMDVFNSPQSGDLAFNGKKVEVKGTGGRFGPRGGMSSFVPRNTVFIEPFIRNNPDQINKYRGKLSSIKVNSAAREKTNDLIYNIIASYDFFPNLQDNMYNIIIDTLDNFYSYKQKFAAEYITPELLKSNNYNNIKKAVFKLYAKGYLEKNKIDGYLINVSSKTLNYIVITLEQLLAPNTGYIDSNKLSVKNFRFNDLYPNININTV